MDISCERSLIMLYRFINIVILAVDTCRGVYLRLVDKYSPAYNFSISTHGSLLKELSVTGPAALFYFDMQGAPIYGTVHVHRAIVYCPLRVSFQARNRCTLTILFLAIVWATWCTYVIISISFS